MEVLSMRVILIGIMLLILAGIQWGCLEDITEAPLVIPGAGIEAPQGLFVHVADGAITLGWHKVENADSYRIYRSIDAADRFERLAEAADTAYVDTDVQNGRVYFYSVCALSADGIEGKWSNEIFAAPAIYGVLINGGDAATGSTSVLLALTAPETTGHMMIAGDALLAGGAWETYAATRQWRLGGPDGEKRVYARFRDESGALSPIVCDSIILDTYAMIESIAINPVPRRYAPGSTAHFTMRVENSERGGAASISFDTFSGSADLYDDGRGGDVTADDGVYEADFHFPESIRGLDVIVLGSFADAAGNAASQFECADKISFTDPPEAVQLIDVVDSSTTSITIRWAESRETYFQSYRIYRNTSAVVSETPSQLVRELSNAAQTSYPDGSLTEGVRYYYRVFVVNDLNETAGSNTISAHTFDATPDPVLLDAPSSIGTTRLTLTWTGNTATDFREYRLYRSTQPGVSTTSVLVSTITDRGVTYFDDTGLNLAVNTYYYRVYVFDLGGKNSRSNEVDTAP